MSIAEFWSSNLWALGIVVAGYNESTRDTQEIHAAMTANIMTVLQQAKHPKRYTVYKLIGNRPNSGVWSGESFRHGSGDAKKSVEAIKQHIRNLQSQPKSDNRW